MTRSNIMKGQNTATTSAIETRELDMPALWGASEPDVCHKCKKVFRDCDDRVERPTYPNKFRLYIYTKRSNIQPRVIRLSLCLIF